MKMKNILFLTTLILLFVTACEKEKPNSSYSPYFTISPTQKVVFAPGNLQWSATNGGSTPTTHTVADGTAAGTWRFAPNQWDTIGANNSNISSTYTGWIDLFGWGTSGYDNKYPYMTSTEYTDYGNGRTDIAGTNYDWGVYNAIYNPKTQTTDAPGTWRTLTRGEWKYLLNKRSVCGRRSWLHIYWHGVPGLMIFPDNFPPELRHELGYRDWEQFEAAGCVFLPAAGVRYGNSAACEAEGRYWSASYIYDDYVFAIKDWFSAGALDLEDGYTSRCQGYSVRLVKDIE